MLQCLKRGRRRLPPPHRLVSLPQSSAAPGGGLPCPALPCPAQGLGGKEMQESSADCAPVLEGFQAGFCRRMWGPLCLRPQDCCSLSLPGLSVGPPGAPSPLCSDHDCVCGWLLCPPVSLCWHMLLLPGIDYYCSVVSRCLGWGGQGSTPHIAQLLGLLHREAQGVLLIWGRTYVCVEP